jgi:hemoglobin
MKPDITSRNDIETVVNLFYEKLKADNELHFFFTDVIPVDWNKHIPLMCSFWENVLFYTGEYEGNPLVTHKKINAIHSTSEAHFTRWLQLFKTTVAENFKGKNADKMVQHAHAIAMIMQNKI